MSAESAREHASTKTFLNDTQRQVIEQVLNSADRIHGLQGLAGSGKTSSLQSIRKERSRLATKLRVLLQRRRPLASSVRLASRRLRFRASSPVDRIIRVLSPPTWHLYMLDESSLASTKQMRSFLGRLGSDDRVLVIGDTRQHQGVDAGRPFQQMQEAGMQTSKLDKIMRQKEPELLKAVQHLASGETVQGIALLADQGRVTEIPNGRDRIAAIARDYATQPENTIIVSPDNRSRQQINEAVRGELQRNGTLKEDAQVFRTLSHRSDKTGADRKWAARYEQENVLQYTTGSKTAGIERDNFATVRSVDTRKNLLTVELENGSSVTYDPRRLQGVHVFREVEREFAVGEKIQFTAPNKDLGLANRDLNTISVMQNGQVTVRMDGKEERSVTFDPREFRQFDHGYAVTSHSSQGLTASRVLAHIGTDSARGLINDRLAYVAISPALDDARIYTNDAETLGQRLATDVTKTAAVELHIPQVLDQTAAPLRSNFTPDIEFEGFGLGI